jgi:hypothetical protein
MVSRICWDGLWITRIRGPWSLRTDGTARVLAFVDDGIRREVDVAASVGDPMHIALGVDGAVYALDVPPADDPETVWSVPMGI